MKELDLSVIIVSWKVKDLLRNCLNSIYQETSQIDFELMVVDNSSCDGTVEMLAEEFPRVTIISNLSNRGFAKAVNQGIKQAQGRYLLLLNPDTVIINGALTKMVDYLDKQPAVGLAGCQLLNSDLSIQPSVRRFPTLADHLIMMFKLHHFIKLKRYLMTEFDYQKEQVVDQIMGAFFMINRKVIDKIGLFDEGYYIWFEEVDFCHRVKQAGFKIIYTPLAQIIHLGGRSFIQTLRIKSQWDFSKSRLRYIRKHQGIFTHLTILLLTPVSLLLTCLVSLISPKNV